MPLRVLGTIYARQRPNGEISLCARTQSESTTIAMSTVEPIPDSTMRTVKKRSFVSITATIQRVAQKIYTLCATCAPVIIRVSATLTPSR